MATDLRRTLMFCLGILEAPEPTLEHRFDLKRRWRFDLAWPDLKVAVEIQGGEWVKGRHVRGLGIKGDCEKMRAAQRQGWVVLPYAGAEVTSNPHACALEIVETLKDRGLEANPAIIPGRLSAVGH